MAQSTAGIKVYHGESTVTSGIPAIPTTWYEIPDITGTPAMHAAPSMIDVTPLSETSQKRYVPGLMDLGGAFEFPANMTAELISAVTTAAADPGTGKVRAFSIVFPAPLSKRYWWTGEIEPVKPGEASVDGAATTTVYISQSTPLQEVAAS
jgi:hypothetical protein